MAESAIASIVLPLLFEKLASGTLQQLGKMLGVRRELEKLQSTLTTIQSVLQDAEEKGVKDKALRDWLVKLKNAAYDADDVLDEVHYELMWRSADIHHGVKNKVNDFFSSHNPLFFRCKMARKVEDIVNKLDQIAAERSKFHLRTEGAAEERRFQGRQTHSHVIEKDITGRGEDKRKIVGMLVNNASSSSGGNVAPRVLPIVGMGGLGKTMLAKIVYNDKEVITYFELRMWVCASEDFNIPILVKEIIVSRGGSGQDIDIASMDRLQQKLKETINLKRYLLVLDDVWNEDPQKWRELRDLLTSGGEGSVILVTTRSEIVAKVVGTLDPHSLAQLSDDGCWELFEQRAFPGGTGKRPELAKIGKKIAKKCRGLPLAANVIGSMMHLKTEEREWLDVLESEVWEMQDGNDGILSVLKLSYQQLPSHLKQCFAFCAIFPKDHEINVDQLIQLWMANSFIPAQGRLQWEEIGEDIFKELASRSFFQDIKVADDNFEDDRTITTCKIHDLIHDLAQSIMSKDCVLLNDKQLKKASNDAYVRYLVIAKDTTLSTLNAGIYNSCKTLRTLVAPRLPLNKYLSKRQDRDSFWSNLRSLRSLRVLDLQKSDISDAPILVNNLKHLRYLDLSNIEIEMLPEAISQLFYLQTLKIDRCRKLCKLPTGMRNMYNLRHVYNRGCDKLDSMPRGLDKLSHLQTLSMFVASKGGGSSGIAELEDLNLGGVLHLCKLENVMSRTDAAKARLGLKKEIESLKLQWEFYTEGAEEILEALQPHEKIQHVEIRNYPGQQFPGWLVSSILVSLRKLTILECYHLTGGERGLKLQHLTSLESLDISHCKALHSINLEGLPSLRKLSIRQCDKLTGGEVGLRLQHLTSLEDLRIIHCPALHSADLEGLHRLRDL